MTDAEIREKVKEAALRERFALKQIEHLFKDGGNTQQIHYSDAWGNDPWDALIHTFYNSTAEGFGLKKRYYVEAKIRTGSYDDLILEKKKWKSLQGCVQDPTQTEILYINFCPEGTYIFNLTKMNTQNLLIEDTLLCNKTTVVSRNQKEEKDIFYLDIKYAKKIEYIYKEKDYLQNKPTLIKENLQGRRLKGLMWEVILNKNNKNK